MIKTYDEALKTLNDIRTYLAISRADDCVEELDKIARYFINEKHKENPTFEECIKEWEERGFEVKWNNENQLKISNYILGILIDKHSKDILIYDSYSYATSQYLSFELHHLLSKTIKAWEKMKNE